MHYSVLQCENAHTVLGWSEWQRPPESRVDQCSNRCFCFLGKVLLKRKYGQSGNVTDVANTPEIRQITLRKSAPKVGNEWGEESCLISHYFLNGSFPPS